MHIQVRTKNFLFFQLIINSEMPRHDFIYEGFKAAPQISYAFFKIYISETVTKKNYEKTGHCSVKAFVRSTIILDSSLSKSQQQMLEGEENLNQLSKKNKRKSFELKKFIIQQDSLSQSPYKLILECTKKQDQICKAIAFNKDQKTMVAGYNCGIVVFDFKNGQLNQKQILSSSKIITTLYFLEKGEQIYIWNFQGYRNMELR